MKRFYVFVTVIACFGLISCATVKPQTRLNQDSSGIGIIIYEKDIFSLKSNVNTVYFVRVEEGESPLQAYQMIPSNYYKGNHRYLLNVKPGKYAAVAASQSYQYSTGGHGGIPRQTIKGEHVILFSEDFIKKTYRNIERGKITFIGDYHIKTAYNIDKADKAQLHFLNQFHPGYKEKGFFSRLTSQERYLFGSLVEYKDSKEVEDEFKKIAYDNFIGSGWEESFYIKQK